MEGRSVHDALEKESVASVRRSGNEMAELPDTPTTTRAKRQSMKRRERAVDMPPEQIR